MNGVYMVYIPSGKVSQRLTSEATGRWIDKATSSETLWAVGAEVNVNSEHPVLMYGTCRTAEELSNLLQLLLSASFCVPIHNEVRLPILQA